ncbi:MAG: hypothetical protein JWQ96_762 [Segetibacter sp.]|nr:hypothetical protein [Segetibacter sp.]
MKSNNDLQLVVQGLQQHGLLKEINVGNNDQLLRLLSLYINELIVNDFSALVQLLYRMDIPEKKLRDVLSGNSSNAGDVIAQMMIERQLQKIESRKKFKQREEDIPDEERW